MAKKNPNIVAKPATIDKPEAESTFETIIYTNITIAFIIISFFYITENFVNILVSI